MNQGPEDLDWGPEPEPVKKLDWPGNIFTCSTNTGVTGEEGFRRLEELMGQRMSSFGECSMLSEHARQKVSYNFLKEVVRRKDLRFPILTTMT